MILSALRSVIEQIGMRAGPHQIQLVTGDAVDQEPVRLDVSVAVALPVQIDLGDRSPELRRDEARFVQQSIFLP